MIVVVMGVSGSGKTTVGRLLAESLGWTFYEGDDFHPRENVEKMRRGEALQDADRMPWLAALQRLIARLAADGRSAVIACSALRASYRELLRRADGELRFVHLDGEAALIAERLSRRTGHFMSRALLPSQLGTLERPGEAEAIILDVAREPEELVAEIRARIGC